MSTSAPLILPIITIDPTFASLIVDVDAGHVPSEEFWVSCYKTEQSSVHTRVRAELDEVDRGLVRFSASGDGGAGEVDVRFGDRGYTVSCSPLAIPATRVALPTQEYRDAERSIPQQPHRITAFDISPDGSRFATGFLDGSVFLYPTAPYYPGSGYSALVSTPLTPTIRVTSRAHLSTITHLRFFPSSRVLLTAAADFSLSILPADLPASDSPASATAQTRVTPARTLRGHTRAITSTAIVGRGRTVISGSLDSTVHLWDVPTSAALTTLPAASPVLSMSLGDTPAPFTPSNGTSNPSLTQETHDTPHELPETAEKTLFVGLQNGTLEAFDLRTKRSVSCTPSDTSTGGISAVLYDPERGLVGTGSTRGVVRIWDVRKMDKPLVEFRRNEAGVEDLVFVPGSEEGGGVRMAVATADGLPYVLSISGFYMGGEAKVGVDVELAGGDCDPVRVIRAWSDGSGDGRVDLWTAGDDGVVRRYLV